MARIIWHSTLAFVLLVGPIISASAIGVVLSSTMVTGIGSDHQTEKKDAHPRRSKLESSNLKHHSHTISSDSQARESDTRESKASESNASESDPSTKE